MSDFKKFFKTTTEFKLKPTRQDNKRYGYSLKGEMIDALREAGLETIRTNPGISVDNIIQMCTEVYIQNEMERLKYELSMIAPQVKDELMPEFEKKRLEQEEIMNQPCDK